MWIEKEKNNLSPFLLQPYKQTIYFPVEQPIAEQFIYIRIGLDHIIIRNNQSMWSDSIGRNIHEWLIIYKAKVDEFKDIMFGCFVGNLRISPPNVSSHADNILNSKFLRIILIGNFRKYWPGTVRDQSRQRKSFSGCWFLGASETGNPGYQNI